VKGNDEGIWRRILRLPWAKKIEKKDPFFIEKLKEEAPGILRRLVEGCREWQQHGLRPPPIVLTATKEYREEMDLLAEFLEECCYLRGAVLHHEEVALHRVRRLVRGLPPTGCRVQPVLPSALGA
jgi:phage/plasmid-associated DNA primase